MKKFVVGDFASSIKTYSYQDVVKFSELSNDFNPVHLNEEFAQETIFKRPIVHGILVAGQISALIANELPGPGSIYLHQELNFTVPVFHGDEITCTVKIIEIKDEKNLYILNTECSNQNGIVVIKGKAIIKLI